MLAARLVDRVLGATPVAAAILGALAVDFVATRAGVPWSADAADDDDRGAPRRPRLDRPARRLASGVALGLAVAGASALVAAAAGGATATLTAPGVSVAFAAMRHGALAVRDELLLRGFAFAAVRRRAVPPSAAVAFGTASGVATVALEPGATPAGVALAGAMGLLAAALWRGTGGWTAVGCIAALRLAWGSLLRGEGLDLAWPDGGLALPPRGWGTPTWLAAAACVGAALVVLRRSSSAGAARKNAVRPPA